jgi:sporulation protein YlmC with PRC-barrel domain
MRADITSMIGLDVYTQKGIFVGRVDDAVIDPEQGIVSGLALGNINKELFDHKGKGVVIPYRLVTAIGDIVLMRHLTRNGQANREEE